MEIERKYLIPELPEHLEQYLHHKIEQGYLCTAPVVRIRRQDDQYYLTYKSGGLMVREKEQMKKDLAVQEAVTFLAENAVEK